MKPIPCTLGGVSYPSIRAASLATGIPHRTLTTRMNPKRAAALQRAWHRKNRERSRAARRRRAGLPNPTRPSPEHCELCGARFTRTPHLDHDHTTGKFRGWLCSNCNTALGLLRDCPRLAQRASVYLLAALV